MSSGPRRTTNNHFESKGSLVLLASLIILFFSFKMAVVTYAFSMNNITSAFILGTEEEEERSAHEFDFVTVSKEHRPKTEGIIPENSRNLRLPNSDNRGETGYGRISIPPPEQQF